MSRIRVLPDILINQIAAGEVIERPSSVVKELLENSLDAGARSLTIDLEGGGRRRLRVADDGEGMTRDDALLALERHATSKLSSAVDLGRIGTLGFRGEALPAIASVSRLNLTTSHDGAAGTCLDVEGGVLKGCRPAGHPRGTTVDVRDLFYNTPARAKFLKSHATELGHIVEMVSAYAVTLPAVRVRLSHDQRVLLEAPPAADERARLIGIFGPEWDEALEVEGGAGGITVRGLLAPPESGASSRRAQHLYVNGRLVRDRLLSHAVASACEAFLPRGRHARLFLFLKCPLEMVDVNVHPAKAEVRFRDARTAHDAVQSAVLEALRQARPFVPAPGPAAGPRPDFPAAWHPPEGPPPAGSSIWQEVAWERRPPEPPASVEPASSACREPIADLPELARGAAALAHYRESYIVAADAEGLLIVDQHAAHERILYEQLLRPERGEQARQELLFPVTIAIPPVLRSDLQDLCARLEAAGISADPFGDGTLAIRAVPALPGSIDTAVLVRDLLDQMESGQPAEAGRPGARERMLATIACHAAIKVRMPLTIEKMNYLINELFRTATPMKCPHGRPAVLRLSHRDLERGFLRP
jgi:DNA mismatch repair protein MutL